MKKFLISLVTIIVFFNSFNLIKADTLFSDNFSSDLSNYALHGGDWTLDAGNLVAPLTASEGDGFIIRYLGLNSNNYGVSVDVTPSNNTGLNGIFLRFNSFNYYSVLYSGTDVYVYRANGDNYDQIGHATISHDPNETYQIRAEINGSNIKAFDNGSLVINIFDIQLTSGYLGLQVVGGTDFSTDSWIFDNLDVYEVGTPPAPTSYPTDTPVPTLSPEPSATPAPLFTPLATPTPVSNNIAVLGSCSVGDYVQDDNQYSRPKPNGFPEVNENTLSNVINTGLGLYFDPNDDYVEWVNNGNYYLLNLNGKSTVNGTTTLPLRGYQDFNSVPNVNVIAPYGYWEGSYYLQWNNSTQKWSYTILNNNFYIETSQPFNEVVWATQNLRYDGSVGSYTWQSGDYGLGSAPTTDELLWTQYDVVSTYNPSLIGDPTGFFNYWWSVFTCWISGRIGIIQTFSQNLQNNFQNFILNLFDPSQAISTANFDDLKIAMESKAPFAYALTVIDQNNSNVSTIPTIGNIVLFLPLIGQYTWSPPPYLSSALFSIRAGITVVLVLMLGLYLFNLSDRLFKK